MKKVISINQPQVFSLKDAHSLLPVIYRITEIAHSEVKALLNRLHAIKSSTSTDSATKSSITNSTANLVLATEIELEIDLEVSRWEQKIEKLGATPKGLWLADFDNGEGYYCWRFPETKVLFYHGYNEGFSGRKEIRGSIEEQQLNQEIFQEP